ncbi:hypothetical protein LZ554_003742 [Drepanopeziza brunnea f. sp. 'monogermtubi']|nr:hypothetical protein LZ554_003742 [Drepanopeziza brunnea f. sp. 'monogermtubi']
MAPSEKAIVAGIKAAVKAIHTTDPETLTVRTARVKAEEDLGLELGFLSQGTWKEKSKVTIKEYASTLQEGDDEEEPEPEPTVVKPKAEKKKPAPKKSEPAKKGAKRASSEKNARPAKRQKKQDTPIEDETSELTELTPEESVASSFEDSADDDAPKKKGLKSKAKVKAKAPVKRQSKSTAKVESDEDGMEIDGSEEEASIEGSDESDAPKRKTKATPKKKAPVKRQSKSKTKIANSDESEDERYSDASAPSKKATTGQPVQKQSGKAVVDSDAESGNETPSQEPVSTAKKDSFKKPPSPMVKNTTPEPKANEGAESESEMSVVLDPTPKPKRQRAPKGEKKAKELKAPKAPKEKAQKVSKAAAALKDLSPDEIQIKTLQSQLKKCGVSKIWQFELKQYGDDNKAKVRHLTKALKEIGMDGRFSEARAREIKEKRELMADVEAVTEMGNKWGKDSGRRSRGAARKKSLREASVDDDAETRGKSNSMQKDDDDDDSDDQPAARKPRARAELAFLSDEEDSD